MYNVLLLTRKDDPKTSILRQTTERRGISDDGMFRFYVNEDIEPDFLVVLSKAFKEPVTYNVARQNTLLLTTEPASVLRYPKKYCRQFGTVFTCQENLHTGNNIYTHAVLPWFVGLGKNNGRNTVNLDFDDFSRQDALPKKKLISVITSNKTFTSGHRRRLQFVKRLKEHFGDQLDLYGAGIRNFDDKYDVLAPYKYHIAIENSCEKFYWTEKMADCFLSDAYPIYCGCTNIFDFFPEGSLSTFSLDDFEGACQLIERLIKEEAYENSREARREAKNLILGKYNLVNMVADHFSQCNAEAPKEKITFQPERHFFNLHNFYQKNFSHAIGKLQQMLKTH
ncbi:hypothetical protein C7Y71_008315 [Pseudoprevotella muciniphila]|uniref:Fucosyltransferase C-terminal domain-containing protein n=1 Tax=Pseudoprevotella muciniphila TaxID=2133944 RepID=A0A5P8E7S6_9BACT|nr:glycosyltransferase family 10 [Pseudoprevotella muciniphila]QFQ13023.1 hypothetical protein C7Y71_008315 [Pseudoprevotella muciniphila]